MSIKTNNNLTSIKDYMTFNGNLLLCRTQHFNMFSELLEC